MSTKRMTILIYFLSLIHNISSCHNLKACSLYDYVQNIFSFRCFRVCSETVFSVTDVYSPYSQSKFLSPPPVEPDLCIQDKPYTEDSPDDSKHYLYTDFQEWLKKLTQKYISIFPIDTKIDNNVRIVSNALFSIVEPVAFKSQVYLVALADEVLSQCIDLDLKATSSSLFTEFVSGNNRNGLFLTSLAHRYGGHQFGIWAGQLGDGRALLLGEVRNRFGDRWELQLKGSGITPYSRNGDGRAVLRSSVREFLASEAMYYLGVPTSRAASLVVSDDTVTRDQFYDGHPRLERTATVLRLAPSWFRIGSLEILAHAGEIDLLKSLLDFIIQTHFLNIDPHDKNKYLILFQHIVSTTAQLVAKWQSVGFTHGVCNTDNFSLLSITIDYGPFGFMESYDSDFVPNTSDDERRYSYHNQPSVGLYNLKKLKLAFDSVFDHSMSRSAEFILNGYDQEYESYYLKHFTEKLGLSSVRQDKNLISMFLRMMEECRADFTMSFRSLSEISLHDLVNGNIGNEIWSLHCIKDHSLFKIFMNSYTNRLKLDGISDLQRQAKMLKCNPRYILRNWMAQTAIIKAERNDFSEVQKLYRIFKQPFTRQEEAEVAGYADKPPEWASSIKVSCSS